MAAAAMSQRDSSVLFGLDIGTTGSPRWMQIKADLLVVPIQTLEGSEAFLRWCGDAGRAWLRCALDRRHGRRLLRQGLDRRAQAVGSVPDGARHHILHCQGKSAFGAEWPSIAEAFEFLPAE
jgi:hypothetical protein